ncbi:MAG TPA: sugar phosphate nucleotidyltransferase [Chitinophagaceae bacterium]|nr:sugar phosphate nucleotidyltransferase [Chitinophagaceae bacterium]
MQPTLVILAAGMASRYGSMKQVQGFGPGGETIMDYSIYDAIRTGFGKIVFIIRRDFEDDFKRIFDPKLKNRIDVDYVFQEMDAFLNGYKAPPERTKPWGTAHAVLCAKNAVKEPFAVINADDFYGRNAFEKAAEFLKEECNPNLYAIIGYELIKTLSDNGTVNRGVCQVDDKGNLSSIIERINIEMKEGIIICDDGKEPKTLPVNTSVSMNFWCFDTSVFPYTEKVFHEFLAENGTNPKSEFFIPIVADQFVKDGGIIKVIPTPAPWFGVTYKEDAPDVEKSLNELVQKGEYAERLWNVHVGGL